MGGTMMNPQILINNPVQVDDWQAWQAEELAIDKALEYVVNGRM